MVRPAGLQRRRAAKYLHSTERVALTHLPGTNPDLCRCGGMTQNFDRHRKELQRQIAEQEKLVRRMIVRGTPNQAAEDRLRQLQQQLAQLKAGR
jgi:hypothetical protein